MRRINGIGQVVVSVAAALTAGSLAWADPAAEEAQPGTAAEQAQPSPLKPHPHPVVVMETSKGTITAELWPDKAEATVANFLSYTDEEFYDGLVFHRVIDGFMIQGGGFTAKMEQRTPGPPIKNEARKDVPNTRGTVAMARARDADSATSQFFINVVDNHNLNHRDKTARGYGYCVFGKVIDGMDVVDAIAKVPTVTRGPYKNVPREPVRIISVRRRTE